MDIIEELQQELSDLQIYLHPHTDFDAKLIFLVYSGDPDYQSFPETLGNFDLIEQLTIINSIWAHLPSQLTELGNIKRLRLHLSNATELEGLTLLNNMISLGLYTPLVTQLPENIGELQKLRFLAIQASLTTLPSSILQLEELKIVYFDIPKLAVSDSEVISELREKVTVRFDNIELEYL